MNVCCITHNEWGKGDSYKALYPVDSLAWGPGGTPIYGQYRYVPRDRLEFLRFLILK